VGNDRQSPLTRFAQALRQGYAWFATPIDGAPIYAARVGLGVTLLAMHLQYAPWFRALFAPSGIGGSQTMQRTAGYDGLAYQAFARFRVLHLIESEAIIAGLYILLLVTAGCFALGYKARAAGVMAAVLHIIFNAHNPHLDTGAAWLIAPFVLYIASCRCDGTISTVAPWGVRVLQVHVCAMYLVAGFARLSAAGWLDGEMVLRALLNAQYGRYDVDWIAIAPALTAVSYLVWILELGAPMMLWIRPVRRYWAIALIAMHGSMELLIDAGWWQLMMISALVTFIPIKRWRWRWPARDGCRCRNSRRKREAKASST
jgi:hypothetical protein